MLAGATGGGRDDSLQAYPALTLMSRVGLALDPASLGLCWARSCLECIRTELDRSVLGGEQAGPRAGPLRPGALAAHACSIPTRAKSSPSPRGTTLNKTENLSALRELKRERHETGSSCGLG